MAFRTGINSLRFNSSAKTGGQDDDPCKVGRTAGKSYVGETVKSTNAVELTGE
jgi:hypothetical protein